MYEKWLKIVFFADISTFLPLNPSLNSVDALCRLELSFSHPQNQVLDFHYIHRGLTEAVLGAHLTENGVFDLLLDTHKPLNEI